ncbi:hypothetical protein TL18_09040 [Methanobrevibacter sp. YE315]|uniref:DUF11 domain-containing protein n=1 Tax=Methanobrevibacter sp. YE315 TaxID=1609968 RepID=UPI000764D1BB|nr:DUF11 domain-containing protein [Methanobrevibacter sp. YE315]AMD18147.1 hypothetical protein TL18_09040 [Methanobrevibacter sp. YE315]
MTCVGAADSDTSGADLNQDQSQDLKVNEASNDISSQEANENTSDNSTGAFLILDNDADKENIYIGDYVTWILSVLNLGPDTAKNVKVTDQLPDGLEYTKHTTTKGVFNPETGIWDIGDLSINDGEVFLDIVTKALTAGEKVNKATLTSDTPNLNENGSYEEEEIDVLEDDDDDDNDFTAKALTAHVTGNPIVLILLALFTIFITRNRFD